MTLSILNSNMIPAVVAITFDEENTPTVHDSVLENDLKNMGICTTPFTELRKADPFLSKRESIFQEIDPEGKNFYRRSITLPTKNASSEEKAYFREIFVKYFQSHLINNGYKLS